MAQKIGSMFYEIGADTTKLEAGLKSSKGQLGAFKAGLGDVVEGLTGLNLATIGVGAAAALLATQIRASIDEASEAEQIQGQLAAVLKSTGGAAGMSAVAINEMASQMQLLNAVDQDEITSAANIMLTFTQIGKTVFPEAMQATLDLSQAMGQDLKSSVVQIGKALNDPIAGITALQRVGVTFNERQKEQIKTLAEHNDMLGAQKIILAELNREFGGSAAQAADTYAGSLKRLDLAIKDLQESFGSGLLPGLTGVTQQLAVNIDMLNKGATVWAVEAYNQRLYGMSLEASMALMRFYYEAQKPVVEQGFLMAAMMTTQLTPALESTTLATSTGASGWAALPPSIQLYIRAADEARAASEGSTTAIGEAGQSMEYLAWKARDAKDQVDAAKQSLQTFGENLGGQVVSALKSAGVEGQALSDAMGILDDSLGTNFEWQNNVALSAQAMAEELKKTGNLEEFKRQLGESKDALILQNDELKKQNDYLRDSEDKLRILTANEWTIKINYQISGSVPGGVGGGGTSGGSGSGHYDQSQGRDVGLADGGSYVVPSGYYESWPVGPGVVASSGERVTVTPQNVTNNHAPNITINVSGAWNPGATAEAIRWQLARYGQGYQGG